MLLRATRKRSQPRGRAWMAEAAFRAAWEGPDPRPADSPLAGWLPGRPPSSGPSSRSSGLCRSLRPNFPRPSPDPGGPRALPGVPCCPLLAAAGLCVSHPPGRGLCIRLSGCEELQIARTAADGGGRPGSMPPAATAGAGPPRASSRPCEQLSRNRGHLGQLTRANYVLGSVVCAHRMMRGRRGGAARVPSEAASEVTRHQELPPLRQVEGDVSV